MEKQYLVIVYHSGSGSRWDGVSVSKPLPKDEAIALYRDTRGEECTTVILVEIVTKLEVPTCEGVSNEVL